jgi:hypothetical protein
MVQRADPAPQYLARLEAVRGRLAAHAMSGVHAGLTGADPATGERWDAGQVWAHLAEFPAYWLAQSQTILRLRAEGALEPIRFGRTKADPGRADAIERDRHLAPERLHERVAAGVATWAAFIAARTSDQWSVRGLHPTLGPLTFSEIVERFLVGHLEEHATQLDELGAPPA